MDDASLPLLQLHGNSLETVNLWSVIILSAVVGTTVLGLLLDGVLRKVMKKWPKAERPRGWVFGALLSSYTLLVPGLVMTLFSYKCAAVNGLYVMNENTENMFAFVKELWESKAHFGACAIVLFAIIIPVLKLILLIAGGLLRHSRNEGRREFARKAIHFVQKISKWASPDMFAYILFLNLVRGLNHPPALNGIFRLDLGFTCFSIFCVASTVSSIGVRSPPEKAEQVEAKSRFSKKVVAMLITVCILTVVFFVTLYYGLYTPCMALRLDIDLLFKSGKIQEKLRPIVEMLHIEDKASADISLVKTLQNLQEWMWHTDPEGTFSYEITAILAWIMVGVFVVGLTILDMIMLVVLAFMVRVEIKREGHRPWLVMEIVHVLRKLSMLDVCVVGIGIIVMAGKIYREMGIILTLSGGLLYLAIAEVCHYMVYYIVTRMALAVPATSSLEEELDNTMSSDSDSDSESSSKSEDDLALKGLGGKL